MEKKKIVFLTGTRADFGKLRPLINKIERSDFFDNYIFVTGIHLLSRFGYTLNEIKKQNYKNIYHFNNQTHHTDMDIILSNTIVGFGNFVKEHKPDVIIIHGDRVEALAGAIVGSLNNILVAHIEGGEISGTVDETIRHAITKMSHIHFVANEKAKRRVIQMGEKEKSVFIIGSPDLDIMRTENLPSLYLVKKHYEIPFDRYALFCYHPVTTSLKTLQKNIKDVISALIESKERYVVIYPNNDLGSDIILEQVKKLEQYDNFKVFPSLRFEFFLTLLKNADFIIGNSSAGVREAGFYAVSAINIGSRQNKRSMNKEIINVPPDKEKVLEAIKIAKNKKIQKSIEFGIGNSTKRFFETLKGDKIWKISPQKEFIDQYLKI